MSKYLELKDAPLVKIEFSSEVKSLLNGMEFDVAKEMIKTGIETLNSDIDVDSLDEDILETLLTKDNSNRIVH